MKNTASLYAKKQTEVLISEGPLELYQARMTARL